MKGGARAPPGPLTNFSCSSQPVSVSAEDMADDTASNGCSVAAIGTAFLAYGLLVSGMLYDIIIAPPSSGQFMDGAGRERALPMRMGRASLNKQYIIEGLSAGLLVVVGSVGFVLLMVRATVSML